MFRVMLWILVASAGFFFAAGSAFILFGHPSEWDDLHNGMSREVVHEKLSPPTVDVFPIKGDIWIQQGAHYKWELIVGYNNTETNAMVNDITMRLHIGAVNGTVVRVKLQNSYIEGILKNPL